jgi:predicted aldo/keto reductase-like oxidoreductase
MEYRILGKTGLKVSVIGFGGIPIQRVTFEEARSIVNRALDLGINFFDTARAYTDSEAKLGAVLKERRKEALIATKSMARTRGDMAADIKRSLEAMGVSYIDLYQLHNVKDQGALEQALSPDGALAALKEARREGLIGHIGITGHIKDFLAEVVKTGEVETVQFSFNAVELKGVRELLDLARETNTGSIIMKPLAGGALQNPGLALRFILSHPVSTVIPGMDALGQVEVNARAASGPLTAEEERILEQEARELGANFCRRCEYCRPCPGEIDIPMIFLLDGYYVRYNLQDWARDRYNGLPAGVDSCLDCGECEERCPYKLPIRRMLKEAKSRFS